MATNKGKILSRCVGFLIAFLCTVASAQVSFDPTKLTAITPGELNVAFQHAVVRITDRRVQLEDLENALRSHNIEELSLRRCSVDGSAPAGLLRQRKYPPALDCEEVVFTGHAQFSSPTAARRWRFARVTFQKDLVLDGLRGRDLALSLHDVEIGGNLIVSDCGAGPDGTGQSAMSQFALAFEDPYPRPELDFERLRVGGRSNFEGSEWMRFICHELPNTSTFEGPVSMERLNCYFVTLEGASFRKPVMLRNSIVACLRLENATFEDGLRIENSKFVEALSVDGAFLGKLELEWNALEGNPLFLPPVSPGGTRLRTFEGLDLATAPTARSWRTLELAWRASGNVAAAGEALYKRRTLEAPHSWERFVWGYGVRPWRAVGWICVVVLGFACLYWLDLWLKNADSASATRALQFSFRSAWEWSYGWKHTATPLWKTVVVLEQIAFKTLLFLALKAMADTSPLLHQLIRTLMPG